MEWTDANQFSAFLLKSDADTLLGIGTRNELVEHGKNNLRMDGISYPLPASEAPQWDMPPPKPKRADVSRSSPAVDPAQLDPLADQRGGAPR